MLELIGTVLFLTVVSTPIVLLVASLLDSTYLSCKNYIYDIDSWDKKTSRVVRYFFGDYGDPFFIHFIWGMLSILCGGILTGVSILGINSVFAEVVAGIVLLVGGTYSMLRLARATVRLRTKLDKHMSDLNAHKGGDV